MNNELIFIFQAMLIAGASLMALRMGKSALIAFISGLTIFANLFVIKQISLCGMDATATDAYTIGGFFGLNLLREYYGASSAQRAIVINFFMLFLFGIVAHLHILYAPNPFDTTHQAYCTILDHAPRIIFASMITYVVAQLFNTALYGFFKRISQNRFYLLRNYASVAISELADTVLFSFLGLYGIVHNITEIIMISYSIKLLVALLGTPLLVLSKYIKKGPSD